MYIYIYIHVNLSLSLYIYISFDFPTCYARLDTYHVLPHDHTLICQFRRCGGIYLFYTNVYKILQIRNTVHAKTNQQGLCCIPTGESVSARRRTRKSTIHVACQMESSFQSFMWLASKQKSLWSGMPNAWLLSICACPRSYGQAAMLSFQSLRREW